MAKNQTYYGEFTEDVGEDQVKLSYSRLHVPDGLFGRPGIANENKLKFSGRDNDFVYWNTSGFHALGGGARRQCSFRLSPEPEPLRLYIREILVRDRDGKLEFAEGQKFLTSGKSWFSESLANMFIQ